MNRCILISIAAAVAIAGAGTAGAQDNPRVGGAAMYATKTIVENAAASKDHTTLVAAVKAADLAGTLSGPGPFTVFAPTNKAFAKLPAGTVDTLVKPENKVQLTGILTYHVVPGAITAQDIATRIRTGNGSATYTTVQGQPLTFRMKGSRFTVSDGQGHSGRITISNVMQSNGIIHVIDTVMMP